MAEPVVEPVGAPSEPVGPITPVEPVAPSEPSTPSEPQPIKVPDEYKEHGWAKKEFKTQDDLFKEIAELQTIKGKKQVPFDYENATDNEKAEYLKSTRPENIDAYNWGEEGTFSDSDKEFFGNMLLEAGIEPYRANKMIEASIKQRESIKNEMFSVDGQKEVLKESFQGEGDWEKKAGEVGASLKQNLNEADQKLLESVPNNILGLIYRLQNNTTKAYGIKEGQDRGQGTNPQISGASLEAKRSEIRNKIDSLKYKQGSYKEVAALNKELAATYTNDPRLNPKK